MILVSYCNNMFRSILTIFKPTYITKRYNQCVLCTVESSITYRVYVRGIKNIKICKVYNRM